MDASILKISIAMMMSAITYQCDGVRIYFYESDAYREQAVSALDGDKLLMLGYGQEIKRLYEEKAFDKLISSIEASQTRYEAGSSPRKLYEGVDFFGGEGNRIKFLNSWIERYPNSWVPYAARAEYFLGEGWRARGGKFRHQTAELQFKRMRDFFSAAEKDIIKTIELKPQYLKSYSNYIEIAQNGVGKLNVNEILALAIAQDPAAYYVRFKYIVTQAPKWGGSYEAVRKFAWDSQKYRDINPRLYALLGHEHKLRAESAKRNKQYEGCVAHYTKAFKYGDLFSWRRGRAYCYGELGRFDEQVEDLSVVASKTDGYSVHKKIARVYVRANDLDKAIEHIQIALDRAPDSASVYDYAGWIYLKSGNSNEALSYFKKSISINPYGAYAAKNIASLYLDKELHEKALPYLEVAARHGKKDAMAWLMYADVLKHLGYEQHMDALAVYLQLVDRNQETEFQRITEIENYLKGKGYWD